MALRRIVGVSWSAGYLFLGSHGIRVVAMYGFARCFTRPPDNLGTPRLLLLARSNPFAPEHINRRGVSPSLYRHSLDASPHAAEVNSRIPISVNADLRTPAHQPEVASNLSGAVPKYPLTLSLPNSAEFAFVSDKSSKICPIPAICMRRGGLTILVRPSSAENAIVVAPRVSTCSCTSRRLRSRLRER